MFVLTYVDKINISFSSTTISTPSETVVELKDDVNVFYVPFTKKRRGFLTLFYEKKAIIAFKIGDY